MDIGDMIQIYIFAGLFNVGLMCKPREDGPGFMFAAFLLWPTLLPVMLGACLRTWSDSLEAKARSRSLGQEGGGDES